MTKKTKNIISLILNIAICIMSFYALLSYFFATGDGNMQVQGVASLRFFTNLSNYYAAIVSLIMIPFGIKNVKNDEQYPDWLVSLKYSSTVTVTLTFITCVVFLGPLTGLRFINYGGFLRGFLFIFRGNVFFLHFATPVCAMIGLGHFDKANEIPKRNALLALIPVLMYGILYFYKVLVLGVENGGWSDFYSFTFGGNYLVSAITAVVMMLGTYAIARLERWVYNKNLTK